MKQLLVTLASLAALGAAVPISTAHAATPGGFVTIQFGRAMQGSFTGTTAQCIPVPGMNNLTYEAQDLQARGMTATADVVVAYTGATADNCKSGEIYTDWADLQGLVATYGWGIASAGATYQNVGLMTPDQQQADICGSLDTFTANGLDAHGLFAYPNNSWTTTVQTNITATCFDYGRSYHAALNTQAKMNPDGIQGTASVTGGLCIAGAALCTQPAPISGQKGKTYISPASLEHQLSIETVGQWLSIQFYKLVSGTGSDGIFSWDCSSPDVTLHWTSQPEMYCQNDFDAILSAVTPGAIVTDPATVATAWGRILP